MLLLILPAMSTKGRLVCLNGVTFALQCFVPVETSSRRARDREHEIWKVILLEPFQCFLQVACSHQNRIRHGISLEQNHENLWGPRLEPMQYQQLSKRTSAANLVSFGGQIDLYLHTAVASVAQEPFFSACPKCPFEGKQLSIGSPGSLEKQTHSGDWLRVKNAGHPKSSTGKRKHLPKTCGPQGISFWPPIQRPKVPS